MKINLAELVVAISHALDFMEIDFLGGVTNHSKRVAYIALRLARQCGLSPEEVFDVVTLSILHDNGIGAAFQQKTHIKDMNSLDMGAAHCLAGEANIKGYPFLTDTCNALAFHHENWDGTGPFKRARNDVPFMAQIIHLADRIELEFHLDNLDYSGKCALDAWLREHTGTLFSGELVTAFRAVSVYPAFWLDLKDSFIHTSLTLQTPRFQREMSYEELRKVTSIFSRIIDSKSKFTRLHSQALSEKAGIMAAHYGYDSETTAKLRIAADLHDLGKLSVSNSILDKPGKLNEAEVDVIQRHTYYTRVSLQSIQGLEEITEWAANHHEKIDGTGYPYRKPEADLDFNSRLLACLDIYQALTEIRPYRAAMSHERTIGILGEMSKQGKLDPAIINDIDSLRESMESSDRQLRDTDEKTGSAQVG